MARSEQPRRCDAELAPLARLLVTLVGALGTAVVAPMPDAVALWTPMAIWAGTSWVVARRGLRIPGDGWIIDLVVVIGLRSLRSDIELEATVALLAAAVWAGYRGRLRGTGAAAVMASLSFAHQPIVGGESTVTTVFFVVILAGAGWLFRLGMDHNRDQRDRVEASRQRIQAVLAAVMHRDQRGIIIFDDQDQIVEINAAALRITGLAGEDLTLGEVRARLLGDPYHDAEGRLLPATDWPIYIARRTGEAVDDVLIGVGPGQDRWLSVTSFPVDTDLGRWVLTYFLDVSDRETTMIRLRTEAEIDPLTGVGNRRRLEQAIVHLPSDTACLGVAVIDLDGFKSVNDQHGHVVGDAVLQAVASRLSALVRPNDVVVRLGGDEFAVLLLAADDQATRAFARRARATLGRPYGIGELTLHVGAAIGVAAGPRERVRRLLHEADGRMYEVKRAPDRRTGTSATT